MYAVVLENIRRFNHEHDHPEDIDHAASQARLLDAIKYADLYFAGEDRIHLDPYNTVVQGPVSSRTRRKSHSVDHKLGTIERKVPTFTVDGLLTWDYGSYTVEQVVWDQLQESEVNCGLRRKRSVRPTDSNLCWVPLRAMMTRVGQKSLQEWYKAQIHPSPDLEGQLKLMYDTPSPHDVMKIVDVRIAIRDDHGADSPSRESKKVLGEWKRLVARWARHLATLQRRVADKRSKEEKAKEKKAEKKEVKKKEAKGKKAPKATGSGGK